MRRAPVTGDVVGRRSRPGPYDSDDDEGPSAEDLARFSDPTKVCPECRKEVFDDTAVCYHCGHAFERTSEGSGRPKVWVIVTAVVVLAVFVWMAVGRVI